ncbi:MAG: acyl-CoA thioesterase II [Microbacteriaceae bacterium]|nr:acyl-CoA thioesterase II [Microbacteriaceae bacterium]
MSSETPLSPDPTAPESLGVDPVADMLAVLDLQATGARTREDIFTAPSQWMPHGRVFGGQVLAQSVIAASRTVPDERAIHSVHGYFLRPGAIDLPITFSVDRIHDGRSFTTRRTQAYQDGQPIFSMIASFQDHDPGLDHQAPMPDGLPEPESLPTAEELIGHLPRGLTAFWTASAFDLRYAGEPIWLHVDGERVAHQVVWVRARRRLPDDPVLQRAAFAYASDFTILESTLRRHGVAWATPGLKMASLDHAMWWHREGRADEWWAYVQEAPNATGGRGLSLGRIYSRDGVLMASVAQEGMIRVPAA